MDRRAFVLATGSALAATRLRAARLPALANPGIQLYTLRGALSRDFEATLEAVARIGYREVEFAGYYGRGPAQLRALLDRLQLAAPSAHVDLGALRRDPGPVLEAANALGHRYVVVAWVAPNERGGPDAWRRFADEFNRFGERARAAGLRFAYHNHDFEFEGSGGPLPFDLLLQGTDPELVWFELDLYWITRAGQDAAAYLRRGRGRYALVHVKDMDGTSERGMADPGAGVIDFPTLLPQARQAGVRHWFVEHDNPRDGLATARAGYEYLRRLEV